MCVTLLLFLCHVCAWATLCTRICYHTAHACMFYCVYMSQCVCSVIAGGYKKLGPLCGSRGTVWTNVWRRPKITNSPNNPDRPRHKACTNISWSTCLWLTYFAGVLKSGRQLLCPRETKWEIIGTSGQPWLAKLKLHITYMNSYTKTHWCRKEIRREDSEQ